jgi:hypothetical protein
LAACAGVVLVKQEKFVVSSRSLRIVFAVLFVFFVVTAFIPDLLLFALLISVSAGFGPLARSFFYLDTVFLYFIAALPMFAALRKRPRSWPAVALAASVIPAVAVIPPLLTRAVAVLKMQYYRADDLNTAFTETPKAVEIADAQRNHTGPNSDLKNAPCDTLCQRLLLSRAVDLVRVTRNPGNGPIPAAQLDYRIEQRANCPDAFADGDIVLPETKDAVASGVCLIARAIDATPVTTRVMIRTDTAEPPRNLAQDIATFAGAVEEVQSLEILTSDAGEWIPKFRQTRATFLYLSTPTMLVFADCREMCVGYPVFTRTRGVLNPFDPDRATLDALLIKGRELQKPLDAAARVLAMLDHMGESPTEIQTQIISDWTLCCSSPSDRNEEVLSRLIRDRRVTNFLSVDVVLYRNREFVEANIDLLLDEMEARGANSEFSDVVGTAVARIDNDLVRSRRDRIHKLISGNDWKRSRGIGIISGRLGLDTTPLISQRLRQPISAGNAALAACTADEAIGRALVPDLLAYLNALPVSDDIPERVPRDVVKSLARFGHFEEAKEIFLARYPKFGRQTVPAERPAQAVNDINACFFG